MHDNILHEECLVSGDIHDSILRDITGVLTKVSLMSTCESTGLEGGNDGCEEGTEGKEWEAQLQSDVAWVREWDEKVERDGGDMQATAADINQGKGSALGPHRITTFRSPTQVTDPMAASIYARATRGPLEGKLKVWQALMQDYPDQEEAKFIEHSIVYGVPYGTQPDLIAKLAANTPLMTGPPRNHKSAELNAPFVTDEISKYELGGQWVSFNAPPVFLDRAIYHPLGVAINRKGKKRLICDATFSGFNDTIRVETATLSYMRFIDTCKFIDELKQTHPELHFFLVDVKGAFRHLHICPADYHKACFYWRGRYYVDTRVFFGSSTGPVLWDTFAKILQWRLERMAAIRSLRILDDLAGACATGPHADFAADICHRLYDVAGFTIEDKKTKLRARRFTFMGVEHNLDTHLASVTDDKWEYIQHELGSFLASAHVNSAVSVKELESLVGLLSWTTDVVYFGRSFLRSAYTLLVKFTITERRWRKTLLSPRVVKDFEWWQSLLQLGNIATVSISKFRYRVPDEELWTDASSTGYGAVWGHRYTTGRWRAEVALSSCGSSTAFIELCAVFFALELWGKAWRGKRIRIYCDNSSTVSIWGNRTSATPRIHRVVERMVLRLIELGIEEVYLVWLPTETNVVADFLSRIQDLLRVLPQQLAQYGLTENCELPVELMTWLGRVSAL